jgi:acetylornithine deacetylase/succinyl-diaminopimelate desuccinylase-like protein
MPLPPPSARRFDPGALIDGLLSRHRGAMGAIADARDTTMAQQLALARVASPTGGEDRRADVMRRHLIALGYADAALDRHGNLTATLAPSAGAAEHPVVCLAHLDSVFDEATPLVPRRHGVQWVCPGIGDNARGLAAMLTIADACRRDDVRSALQRPLVFVATVGEEAEGNLAGARGWFGDRAAAGGTAHAAIALDGPGDRYIVHQAVASHRWRIAFHGPGGHPWADQGTPNPALALADFAQRVAAVPVRLGCGLTITVTRLGGGESLTAVPRRAWCDIDLRTIDPPVLTHAEREVRRLAAVCADAWSSAGAGAASAVRLRAELTLLGERPGGALPSDHPLVMMTAAATERLGETPQSASASTDANVPIAMGIPAITIGAGGRGGGAHTCDEWYEDHHGDRGVRRAFLALLAAATTKATAH